MKFVNPRAVIFGGDFGDVESRAIFYVDAFGKLYDATADHEIMSVLPIVERDPRDPYLYPQAVGYLKEWASAFDIPIAMIDEIEVEAYAEIPGDRVGLVRYRHALTGNFWFHAMYARPDDESMIERTAIEVLACMCSALNLGIAQESSYSASRQILAKALVEFKREAQSHV
jgi:hypothetical protein